MLARPCRPQSPDKLEPMLSPVRWGSPETVGGCEAEVYVRGKDVMVNPMGCKVAAASSLVFRSCSLWVVCCLAPLQLFQH